MEQLPEYNKIKDDIPPEYNIIYREYKQKYEFWSLTSLFFCLVGTLGVFLIVFEKCIELLPNINIEVVMDITVYILTICMILGSISFGISNYYHNKIVIN